MRWPAEWEPHEAVWIGFPGNPIEWPIDLAEAQREVAAFANAVSDRGRGEQVLLVCRNAEDAQQARTLVNSMIEIIIEPFGDIWLRDTGPIITVGPTGRCAHDFRFNGWGGKFDMTGDEDIAKRLSVGADIPLVSEDWILEGGAIDGDGDGSLITTRQCLHNANRNAELNDTDTKEKLATALGASQIIWLSDGLQADHTDGHVDNLARFVAMNTVAIPAADQTDDPNATIFEEAAKIAGDSGLDVVRIPSVGRYEVDGAIAPASYMNFYIANSVVVIPQYGAANDAAAVDAIAKQFPDRKAVGLSSKALLRGGGSFHCISQQIPAA